MEMYVQFKTYVIIFKLVTFTRFSNCCLPLYDSCSVHSRCVNRITTYVLSTYTIQISRKTFIQSVLIFVFVHQNWLMFVSVLVRNSFFVNQIKSAVNDVSYCGIILPSSLSDIHVDFVND